MTILAQRLAAARATRGLTLHALAASARVTVRELQHYEHGTRTPGITNLAAIAAVLGVSVDWLCGLVDDPAAHAGVERLVPGIGDLDAQDLGMIADLVAVMRQHAIDRRSAA